MSFQTGLSGLNASSKSLDVIGNNIANANTVGMKSSRAEFADMVASSLGSGGSTPTAGIGVQVANIAQSFTQGNLNITGNSLDVAVNGGGFFYLNRADGSEAFTRDGQFKLDKNGFLITNTGANVMGYSTNITTGKPDGIALQKLQLPTSAPIAASKTSKISAEFNLDARAPTATSSTSPTQFGTSLTTYDTQGVAIPLSLYFVKSDDNKWEAFTNSTTAQTTLTTATTAAAVVTTASSTAVATANTAGLAGGANAVGSAAYNALYQASLAADASTDVQNANTAGVNAAVATLAASGTPTYNNAYTAAYNNSIKTAAAAAAAPTYAANRSFQMTFDTAGKLTAPLVNPTLTITSPSPSIGNFTVGLDVSKVSQFGTSFNVSNLTQDGYTAGQLTGVTIEPTGGISTRYSNGQTQYRGQLALADFRNVQGLAPIGAGEYQVTNTSGLPVPGNPGVGKFGELRSGALEESNVDLTAELVNMMTAQRSYQANAQTIKTQDQVLSTLVNLR
jgi:flagellar hook protein FlgE